MQLELVGLVAFGFRDALLILNLLNVLFFYKKN